MIKLVNLTMKKFCCKVDSTFYNFFSQKET